MLLAHLDENDDDEEMYEFHFFLICFSIVYRKSMRNR